MLVDLPAQVSITCPACGRGFSVASRDLSQRERLGCPFCSEEFDVYIGLEPQLRSKVYHAMRNAVEQRVYEQQQMDSGDYFEDAANVRRADHPEGPGQG